MCLIATIKCLLNGLKLLLSVTIIIFIKLKLCYKTLTWSDVIWKVCVNPKRKQIHCTPSLHVKLDVNRTANRCAKWCPPYLVWGDTNGLASTAGQNEKCDHVKVCGHALYSNMLFAFTIPYMKFIYNFYCFKQKKKKNQTSFSKEAKLYKVLFRKYPWRTSLPVVVSFVVENSNKFSLFSYTVCYCMKYFKNKRNDEDEWE